MARSPAPAAAGEDEYARIFHEAQRAADTIFAHYQLSQLLATHERPATMAQAVLDELVHVCGATGGALWLGWATGASQELVATAGSVDPPVVPPSAEPDEAVERAADAWVGVALEDVGTIALAFGDQPMDAAARRFLSLVRHELAIALRAALLRDALERERSELAAVIQGASDAIVLVDADRRVTRINPAAERMLARSAEWAIGRRCHEVLGCEPAGDPPRPCRGRCPLEAVVATGEAIDGDERSLPGAEAVVGSYARTATSADGRAQAVAILRDTSELARLAELRRGFLGSVSHELRTPLALIKGYVETMTDLDLDGAAARAYLDRISQATDRLDALVAQILDATHLAADHLDLEMEPVEVEPMLRAAAHDVAMRFPGLRLRLEIPTGVPPVVGDPARLRQVLDNLIANAAKYGDARSGPIDVRATNEEDTVIIRVEDHGIGVPPDERELVFEQFQRGRTARERNVPGSGLGLAISRRIVEAHGGSIAFDPDLEAGAAVVVRLPASEVLA